MDEIIIDTDVLIDLLEKESKDRLFTLITRYTLCIPVIVYFEFMTGAYRCNRIYYGAILKKFLKVIPLTIEIAEKAAEIEAKLMEDGCPLDPRDVLIAATAIVEKKPLWTRNIRHFKRLKNHGLKLVNRLIV